MRRRSGVEKVASVTAGRTSAAQLSQPETGSHAELDGEEQDEHDARPEDGHRGTEEDDERRPVIEDGVATDGAQDAERAAR